MEYKRPLPSTHKLRLLANWSGPFPLKNHYLIVGAIRYGLDDNLVQFLRLFPDNETFQSREDFLQRARSLELLISAEQEMPRELLHNPQD